MNTQITLVIDVISDWASDKAAEEIARLIRDEYPIKVCSVDVRRILDDATDPGCWLRAPGSGEG